MTERNKVIETDVAVIGAGPGGTAAALTAAGAGRKTALIDGGPLGGTCLNVGCVPTKAWLAAEHAARISGWAVRFGNPAPPPFDFSAIKAHQEKVVETVQKGLAFVFRKKGIEHISGRAVFVSEKEIAVDGGATTVRFDKAVIATGTAPMNLFGDAPGYYNTDTIFRLDVVPSSMVIVGAGAAGIEMATFFSGMGCAVTVIEALEDILPIEDAEIRAVVKRELKKKGVTFKTGAPVKSVEPTGNGCRVETERGDAIEAEAFLSVIGRRPRTKDLGLETVGVTTDRRGFIEVNDTMATTVDGIYAVGDVAGNYLLAYTAHHEGVVAARNILGEAARIDYRHVPSVIYAEPEVGSIGATEQALKEAGTPYRVGRYHIRALARAQAGGEVAGLVKVLVTDDGAIAGIHIASPMATELIHAGVTAMAGGMSAEALADTLFGHPTFSEAITLAAADALGKSIYS